MVRVDSTSRYKLYHAEPAVHSKVITQQVPRHLRRLWKTASSVTSIHMNKVITPSADASARSSASGQLCQLCVRYCFGECFALEPCDCICNRSRQKMLHEDALCIQREAQSLKAHILLSRMCWVFWELSPICTLLCSDEINTLPKHHPPLVFSAMRLNILACHNRTVAFITSASSKMQTLIV